MLFGDFDTPFVLITTLFGHEIWTLVCWLIMADVLHCYWTHSKAGKQNMSQGTLFLSYWLANQFLNGHQLFATNWKSDVSHYLYPLPNFTYSHDFYSVFLGSGYVLIPRNKAPHLSAITHRSIIQLKIKPLSAPLSKKNWKRGNMERTP